METRYALATERTQEFVGNSWKFVLKKKAFSKNCCIFDFVEDRLHMTSSTSVTTRPIMRACRLSLLHRFGNTKKNMFFLWYFTRFR